MLSSDVGARNNPETRPGYTAACCGTDDVSLGGTRNVGEYAVVGFRLIEGPARGVVTGDDHRSAGSVGQMTVEHPVKACSPSCRPFIGNKPAVAVKPARKHERLSPRGRAQVQHVVSGGHTEGDGNDGARGVQVVGFGQAVGEGSVDRI